MCKYPNLDLVNMNACIKFGEDLSICSQDIERKQSSGINRLCVQSQPRPCQYQCIKFYQFVLKILSGNEYLQVHSIRQNNICIYTAYDKIIFAIAQQRQKNICNYYAYDKRICAITQHTSKEYLQLYSKE